MQKPHLRAPLALAVLLVATSLGASPLRTFSLLAARAGAPTAAAPGEASLDQALIQETLEFLAADDKKGRKPGSPELEGAVFDHLISRLEAWGLEPAGDAAGTTFKQAFRASSWWPFLGEGPEPLHEHVDRELFCAEPNEHGFALDPAGNPVGVTPAEFEARLGVRALGADLRARAIQAAYDTHNIAAMVPGSDAELAEEVVVLGAHIDHIGHRGSSIYNGADDNASGSSILLNLAKAFADLRAAGQGPKRTMLFLWFSAEEMGLLGSKYWVENPTVELSRVRTMINMDMIGRTEGEEISVWDGSSAGEDTVFHQWHDTDSLGFEHVNHDLGNKLRRSDQYSFYRKGIPVLFFFEGYQGNSTRMNPDYHRASDTAEKIDFSKLYRAAGFIYRHAYRASYLPLPARRSAAD